MDSFLPILIHNMSKEHLFIDTLFADLHSRVPAADMSSFYAPRTPSSTEVAAKAEDKMELDTESEYETSENSETEMSDGGPRRIGLWCDPSISALMLLIKRQAAAHRPRQSPHSLLNQKGSTPQGNP